MPVLATELMVKEQIRQMGGKVKQASTVCFGFCLVSEGGKRDLSPHRKKLLKKFVIGMMFMILQLPMGLSRQTSAGEEKEFNKVVATASVFLVQREPGAGSNLNSHKAIVRLEY